MLDLAFYNRTAEKQFPEEFFKRILDCAIEEIGRENENLELAVSLVSPEEIKGLNKQNRKKDSVTDVLSFPELGDIFICPERVREDAEREGISFEQRMAWATVHGFLHVIGFDHERSKTEEERMFALEHKILEKCRS